MYAYKVHAGTYFWNFSHYSTYQPTRSTSTVTYWYRKSSKSTYEYVLFCVVHGLLRCMAVHALPMAVHDGIWQYSFQSIMDYVSTWWYIIDWVCAPPTVRAVEPAGGPGRTEGEPGPAWPDLGPAQE
jgi:hypothetical protein